MVTLFANPDFRSDDVLSSEPFSLEDQSPFLKARLEKLIHENDQNKTIFMPITHQGHWFYLLKQKDVWVIKDSQPFLEGDEFSARQTSILKHSIEFIERLTGLADPVVTFETTGEQNNDYDCGTQVTNAYRALTDKDHVRQPHKNILIELAQNQVLPKEKLPENIEEIFGPKLVAQPKLSGSPKSSTVIQKEQSSPIISETPMVLDLSISSGLPASSAPLFNQAAIIIKPKPLVEPNPQESLISQVEVPVPLAKKLKVIPKQFTKENFLRLLEPIGEKQEKRLKHYTSADMAVTDLKEAITQAANKFYESEFSENSLKTFETKCTEAIDAAKDALGSHRDTLGVVFAGIKNFFVVLWKSITDSSDRDHRLKFFDGRTDSAKMLEDLREDVQAKQNQYRGVLPSLD
jgi:hypothetical protein